MMTATSLLQSTAYIPALATRPFLAALMVAILARWGPAFQSGGIWLQPAPATPGWFVHDTTLIVLGILALSEIIARKNQDLRAILDEVDPFLKGGVALIVTFVVVDEESGALLGSMVGGVDQYTVVNMGWSLVMGAVTWGVAQVRTGFYRLLGELDDGDDLGLQQALMWLEDAGVPFIVVLGSFLPLIALGVFGLSILSVWLVELYFERRETLSKIPCSHCEQVIHPSALICHHCGQDNAAPRQVGTFGQAGRKIIADHDQQELHLLVRKRCPVCATRLKEQMVQQRCPTCETVTFRDDAAVEDYLRALRPSLAKTLGVCFALSFIPVIGLAPGIIYYRLSLIASLRRYVPRTSGCLTRWGVRLLNLLLIALQPIPILGAFMLPILCLTNYVIYRQVLLRAAGHINAGEFGELAPA